MLPGGRGGEFIIVAAIALIVVGPKDLPKLLRQLGRFVGKMRGMADDFKASFEDMARQSELDDLRKEVEAMRTQNAPSIFNDVHNEMRALDSEVRDHLTLENQRQAMVPPEAEPAAVPEVSEPQMEGLPPKSAAPEPAPAPKPRKPRAPKAAVETAAEPLEKPAKPQSPAKKTSRAKKANAEEVKS